MRRTLYCRDEPLWTRATKVARQKRVSLSSLVEDALRRRLAEAPTRVPEVTVDGERYVPARSAARREPACTYCGAREAAHTDIRHGVRGHVRGDTRHLPEVLQVWHAFTTDPVRLDAVETKA